MENANVKKEIICQFNKTHPFNGWDIKVNWVASNKLWLLGHFKSPDGEWSGEVRINMEHTNYLDITGE